MTDDLSIHIIEMPKFLKDVDSLQNSLEDWVYLLNEAGNIL
ncbi:MAG: PD-(D/E)XK nuclease family transposase [Leptospiraceae bacterium]|nr:PD-(D/E)XK nuclease family transposase [Leptospiraceae bacterium]